MIQRVTLIRKHGSQNWSVALQPTVPMREHRRFLKRYRIARKDADIAEIMLCQPLRSVSMERLKQKPKPLPPQPVSVAQTVAAVSAAGAAAVKRVRASASTMASRLRG